MSAPDPKLHPVEAPAPAGDPAVRRSRRRRILTGVGAVVAAAILALGSWAFLTRGEVSTDDAFVEADVVPVAPRVGGTIAEILVADNASVSKGAPILKIDDADYRARVRLAEAELATARAQLAAAEAQVGAARSTVSRAEAESERAQLDLRRAEELKRGEAIPAERFDATRTSAEAARAGASANRARYAAALANAEISRARVEGARAALELAQLQLSYTVVSAAADGVVSRLSARVGQIVQPGQVAGYLVPSRTYVVANFKETQTGAIRPGQKADIELDAYGGLKLEGRVESLSGGTGARFALLPPDNASGNFVKVVERVPVRIVWTAPPSGMSLRAGLSATVTVHTR